MSLNRRRMMAVSLGSGALLAAGAWKLSQPTSEPTTGITRESWALGAEVSITVMGLCRADAQQALDAAFAELETVEQVMSLYRSESQISRLNRDGRLEQPHPYLVEVLKHAAVTSALTEGAFDITVQPLWNLFSTAQKSGEQPPVEEIEVALQRIDWRGVVVSRERVQLTKPVEAITLNGIAQGFAADRVLAVLKTHGVQHALINTGEIHGLGAKPNGENWTVGIQHPREQDAFVALATLRGRAMATSGDYETTFSADFSAHHIFNPRTGRSPSELASVTIAAPTAMQADALGTSAMVLGLDRSLQLFQRLHDVDALLVRKDGSFVQTPGFPA